ncbi:MAG TPA: DUF4169 family protein [Caulobacteraceae bacterium]|nr:DUF4169 family protein [Caulobacteraceae bacterium]
MADVVNLNRARKARKRHTQLRTASENRVKFGRTGAQKAADRAEEAARLHRLDHTKREP